MKKVLEQLFNHQYLSRQEAKEILGKISEGNYNISQISAFLSVFNMRSLTLEELRGFRDCLHERCISVDLAEFKPVDLCGTGGDGKDTFNISTLASFVAAGAGVKVAKHGNYGVSSSCGSSNVMEHLGYRFTNDANILKRQIEKSGICFLHAPLFHPSMKEVAPIRKEMGIKTFFNMLGPMVNPCFPKHQLVGVSSLELQRYYKYVYEQEDVEYRIIHSLDGHDEISLTSKAKVMSPKEEYLLHPSEITNLNITAQSIVGGKELDSSAKLFLEILRGEGSQEQATVVCINAAMAIQCCKPSLSLTASMSLATESLESGQALKSFETLLSI